MKQYYEIKELANLEIDRRYFVSIKKFNPEIAQIFVFWENSLK